MEDKKSNDAFVQVVLDMADIFCKIAEQEIGHMNMLHGIAVKIIDRYKKRRKGSSCCYASYLVL